MTKILVADDEQDIRELVRYTLQFAGYSVILASNGEEVIEAAQRELPDLILLDVRMPRINGYDACIRIKADERTQKIPVVFLSAKGQESEVHAGLEAGADDYILKPFSPDQLIERIKSRINDRSRI